MATMRSILRDLDRHIHLFDLDQGDLGEDLMDVAAGVIRQDIDGQVDPDGQPWPELSDAYATWKATVAPGNPMAILYHQMIDSEQIAGERWVSPTEGRMVFGVDEVPKQEAVWFQEGDPNNNQPPRRFYEFSLESLTRMDAHLDRHFDANV